MMIVRLHRARAIKHAVKLMSMMAAKGMMSVTRQALALEVLDEQRLIPTTLFIPKGDVDIVVENGPPIPNVRIIMLHFDRILDCYSDNDPIQFRFHSDGHFAHIAFDHDCKKLKCVVLFHVLTIGEVLETLPASVANPPQFYTARFDLRNRIQFSILPIWFGGYLLNSWTHQTRIDVQFRSLIVMAYSQMGLPGFVPQYNFPPSAEGTDLHYDISFYSYDYICRANAISRHAMICTGRDPVTNSYRDPRMIFLLDGSTILIFILQFDSPVVRPVVQWFL